MAGEQRIVPFAEIERKKSAARAGDITKDAKQTQAAEERLRKLSDWMENERNRQAQPRYEMAIDEDFYDGLQWDDADAAELMSRGQAPNVYNKIKPAVDWLSGTERRTRIDFKVYPRSNTDRDEAENKTKLIKYLSDVNKSQYARSRAFTDAVKVGLGWLECGIRSDPTAELIYDRYENWRNMLHDSYSAELDLKDARYLLRRRWTDTDVGVSMFPRHKDAIEAGSMFSELADVEDDDEWYLGQRLSASYGEGSGARRTMVDSGGNSFNRRERVKMYEMWYRYPTKGMFMVGGDLNGVQFDPQEEYHLWLAQKQACGVVERMAMLMRCGVFIKGTLLADVPSPYRHNDFPFTPVWGNRRGRDNQPYGMVRSVRDPQEDFNKRMSKALYALSTRRVVMDEGAMPDEVDIEDLREEVARPDSIIEKKQGHEFELHVDTEIAEEHLKYAMIDSQMIEQGSGVTDELLGRKTNAVSGKAIEARQDQGSTVTTIYFDNYRFAFQTHGQKLLSLSEQFMSMQKTIRVIGERNGYDFITINEPGQDKQGQPLLMNDITKAQADFIVSAQDFRESMRQAAYEQLLEMVGKLSAIDPKLGLQILDDVLEFADLPGAENIIKTVRQMTGKRPADQQLSPEEQQAEEQKKQQENAEQQMAKQLAMKGAMAEVEEKMAKVEKLRAEAAQIQSEIGGGDNGEGAAALQKIKDETNKLVDALRTQVQSATFKAALAAAGNDTKLAIAKLNSATALQVADRSAGSREGIALLGVNHEAQSEAEAFQRQQFMDAAGRQFDAGQADRAREHEVTQAEAGRAHEATQAEAGHTRDVQVRQLERYHDAKAQERDQQFTERTAAQQREHEAQSADADRKHETAAQREARQHESTQADAQRQHDTKRETTKAAVTDKQNERKASADQAVRKLTTKVQQLAKEVKTASPATKTAAKKPPTKR